MGIFESVVGLKNLILYMKIHHSNNNVRMKKKREEKGGRISQSGEEIPRANQSIFNVDHILSQKQRNV